MFEVIETRFLHCLSKYPNLVLLVGGDFNIALNGSLDRWPPNAKKIFTFQSVDFNAKTQLVRYMERGKILMLNSIHVVIKLAFLCYV